MLVDGRVIARDILRDVQTVVAGRERSPHLRVFTYAPNFETQKFLALKQARASEVGITVTVTEFSDSDSPAEMVEAIALAHTDSDGIVIQLPFPEKIHIAPLLEGIAASHDVDVLRYRGEEADILPPVVGAIDAIAATHGLTWVDKKVVVVGSGRLVGAPAALYVRGKGAEVVIVGKDSHNSKEFIKSAEVLILGAGVPGLVTAAEVTPGVVVFDAGTSEEGGMLVGDAASDIVDVASLVTPVPGGIGPITIAILLQNLVRLASNQ